MSLTALTFLGLFGLACVASLRSPPIALFTYIAIFYLHPPSRWWGHDLPDLRWSLLTALLALASVMINRRDSGRPAWISLTPAKLIIAFVAWFWIQAIWALDRPTHIEGAILWTKYALLSYLIYSIVDSKQRINGMLMAHVVGCAYLGYLGYTAPAGGRLEGVGGPGIDDANTLGMQVSTGAVAAGMLLFTANYAQRIAQILCLPFILNTIVLTMTRGGLLGLFAGGIAAGYLTPRRFKPVFVFFAVLGGISFVALTHDQFWDRMLTTAKAATEKDGQLDHSAQTRIVLAQAELRMFLDHPMGAGHTGTAELSRQYLAVEYLTNPNGRQEEGARASHNTILSVLVDHGLPGILLFLGFALWVVRALRHTSGEPDYQLQVLKATVGGMLAVTVMSGMFTNYLKAEVQIWAVSLLFSIIAIEKVTAGQSAATPSKLARPAKA